MTITRLVKQITTLTVALWALPAHASQDDLGTGGDAADLSSPGFGATAISPNSSGLGEIELGPDTYDMYRFTATGGPNFIRVVFFPTSSVSGTNLEVTLYDHDYALMGVWTSTGTAVNEVRFTSRTTGGYSIRVRAIGTPSGLTEYFLGVETKSHKALPSSWHGIIGWTPANPPDIVGSLPTGYSGTPGLPGLVASDPDAYHESNGPGTGSASATPAEYHVRHHGEPGTPGWYSALIADTLSASSDYNFGNSKVECDAGIDTEEDGTYGDIYLKAFGLQIKGFGWETVKIAQGLKIGVNFPIGGTTLGSELAFSNSPGDWVGWSKKKTWSGAAKNFIWLGLPWTVYLDGYADFSIGGEAKWPSNNSANESELKVGVGGKAGLNLRFGVGVTVDDDGVSAGIEGNAELVNVNFRFEYLLDGDGYLVDSMVGLVTWKGVCVNVGLYARAEAGGEGYSGSWTPFEPSCWQEETFTLFTQLEDETVPLP